MAILGLLLQKGLNTDVVNLLLTQFHKKSAGGLRSSEVFSAIVQSSAVFCIFWKFPQDLG